MAIEFIPDDVASGYSLSLINANFDEVSIALQDALSRSGKTPNQLTADIDLNSNDLLNVGTIAATDFTIAGSGVTAAVQEAVDAAVNAAASAVAAQAALADFQVGSLVNFIALGDGVTAVYALDAVAQSTNTVVVIGGVTQVPYDLTSAPDGFTLVDGTLTFSESVPTGAIIFAQTFNTVPVGQPSAALTSILDTGGYYTSATVEGALAEIGADLAAPVVIDSPAKPENYVGTDTQKVQQALDSGNPEVRIDDTYVVGALTLPSTLRELSGYGLLQQAAAGSRVLVGTNLTQRMTLAIDITGTATSGHTGHTANDDAIFLTDCDNVTIEGCTIRDFLFRPVLVMGANDLRIENNQFLNNSIGPRLIDAHGFRFIGNNLIGKCMLADVFSTGLGLESEGGIAPFGRPVCSDVWIKGNRVEGFGASQGILVHGGIDVHCIDNDVVGSTAGISFNPYNTVDYIYRPIIANNRVQANTTLTWEAEFGGNSAIICQAGPATGGGNTPNIIQPIISGNVIIGGNFLLGGINEGSIQCGFTEDANITGNISRSSRATGISLYECLGANVSGNLVSNVAVGLGSGSGQRVGLWASLSTGGVHANTFRSVGTTLDAAGMTASTNVSI